MVGHAAFLMGDLFTYLYDEPKTARDYLAFAKQYWPDDPDLIREQKKLDAKFGNDGYVPEPLKFYSFDLKKEAEKLKK